MFRWVRKAWPVLVLLILAAILAAVQNRATRAGKSSPIRGPALVLLRPFELVETGVTTGLSRVTVGFRSKAQLQANNLRLQREVALLRAQNSRFASLGNENNRLRKLLAMEQRSPDGKNWVAADVVARHPSQWFQFITLDHGARSGIRIDSVVLAPEGVVGTVRGVGLDSCDVLLLTDPTSNAGASVARTHDAGYVRGTGHNELTLNFFDRDHGVKVGDAVVTSPFSSIYPTGLPIGVVLSIRDEQDTTTRVASIRPAAPLDHLENVVVIP